MGINFDKGVRLPMAKLSFETSTFVSGKYAAAQPRRDVVGNNQETACLAYYPIFGAMAEQIDHLSVLQIPLFDVGWMQEDDVASASDAAIAIVQIVDGSVVLIVRSDRHQPQLPGRQRQIGDRHAS